MPILLNPAWVDYEQRRPVPPVPPTLAPVGPIPNTGTTAGVDNVPQSNHFQFTVPAGVFTGDVMIAVVSCAAFTSPSPAIAAPTSGGGLWAQVSSLADSGPDAGFNVYGTVWYRTATAADPGSVFTVFFSGTVGVTDAFYWAVALESYTSARVVNPIDVAPAPNGAVGTAVTFPSAVTGADADWALSLITAVGVAHTPPAGMTSRQVMTSGATNRAEIWDSNASVGSAGITIGGQTITSGSADQWGVFTAGLAPLLLPVSGPFYAAAVATDNTGTGAWLNTGNATGAPDGNSASWAVS